MRPHFEPAASSALGARLARRTAPVLFAALILVLSIAPGVGAADDRTDWASAFENARRTVPGFRVGSIDEFRKLTEHRISLLSDGATVSSFVLSNGDQIRCIEISSQRSLAASGNPLQLAPGTPPADDAVTAPRTPDASIGSHGAEFGLDGTLDPEGNERSCPARTFPKLIPRLENLYRFRTLEDVFQKTPSGTGSRSAHPNSPIVPSSQSSSAVDHEYAHAYQWANNIGMRADFNLWSPAVARPGEFSLSQLWVSRGSTTDDSLQTAETGWQVYPDYYGDATARLFVYSTSGNYQTGTGCYNHDCAAFVQTDSSVVLGGSFTSYSTQGGTQYSLPLAFYRDPTSPYNWWLKLNDIWVGYYPISRFDTQGLAGFSEHVDFGGEIVNTWYGGEHTTTDMGSGRFPSEGFGAAAYTKKIQYWDLSGNLVDASSLTRSVTNASYYDLSLATSGDSNWRHYFYFGGPGRIASSPPAANFTFPANPRSGQPVQFMDTSTGSPTSWSWAFGDGGASTAQNPAHTFNAGTYQVSLTASNADGSSSKMQTVVVTSGGGGVCTASSTTMCLIGGRYRITSTWKNQYASGAISTLNRSTLTSATGAFWLTDSNTYEYLIRINTATDNGRAWIAIPTFTDVEFFVVVEDLVNGQSKTYRNPPYGKTLIYDPFYFVYP
ncbi:MAG TPA: neprosin family prolyl endopeptidase [Thermoanaerobaculia bacterium]|nr:neprosin family prolyl endopeptidase [Thermoanaerobaculia bacterium]